MEPITPQYDKDGKIIPTGTISQGRIGLKAKFLNTDLGKALFGLPESQRTYNSGLQKTIEQGGILNLLTPFGFETKSQDEFDIKQNFKNQGIDDKRAAYLSNVILESRKELRDKQIKNIIVKDKGVPKVLQRFNDKEILEPVDQKLLGKRAVSQLPINKSSFLAEQNSITQQYQSIKKLDEMIDLSPQEKKAVKQFFFNESLDRIFGVVDVVTLGISSVARTGITKAVMSSSAKEIAATSSKAEIGKIIDSSLDGRLLNPKVKKELVDLASKTTEPSVILEQINAARKLNQKYLNFQAGKVQIGKNAEQLSQGQKALKEVDEIFKKTQKTKFSDPLGRSRLGKFVSDFSTNFISQGRVLGDLETFVKGKPSNNIRTQFELLPGAKGQAMEIAKQFEKNLQIPKGQYNNFRNYLFLNRTLERLERGVKTGNWTIEKTQIALAQFKNDLGENTIKQLEASFNYYVKNTDDFILKPLRDNGIIDDVAYEKIKSVNNKYAYFDVVQKTFDDFDPLIGSLNPIKKLKGINDDDFSLNDIVQSTMQQIVKANLSVEINSVKKELANLARFGKNNPDIKNVIRKVNPDFAKPRDGFKYIPYRADGKTKYLEVPDEVADVFLNTPVNKNFITDILKIAAYPLRFGATAANIGFQIINPALDIPNQMLISKSGIDSIKDFYRYPTGLVYSLITSALKNVGGYNNKLAQEYLMSKSALSNFQEMITPTSLDTSAITVGKKLKNAGQGLLTMLDEWTKLLSFQRGLRKEGIARFGFSDLFNKYDSVFDTISYKEREKFKKQLMDIAWETRNFGGSPDFGKISKMNPEMNLLFMFFSARMQGSANTMNRLFVDMFKKGAPRKQSLKAWARLTGAVILPATAAGLINRLPGYREDYDRINDMDKKNYIHIPLDRYVTMQTDTGEEKVRDYLRIPIRGAIGYVANTTEDVIDFMHKKDPEAALGFALTFAFNFLPISANFNSFEEFVKSIGAATNPAIKVPLEAATNTNFYFNMPINPTYLDGAETRKLKDRSLIYRGNTPEFYKKLGVAINKSPLMLKYITDAFTGGGLNQFNRRETLEGRSDFSESPAGRRFFRSRFVEKSGAYQQAEDFESQIEKKQLLKTRRINEVYETTKQIQTSEERKSYLKSIAQTEPDIVEGVLDKYEKIELSPLEKKIKSFPVKDGSRAEFVYNQMQKLETSEKRKQYLKDLYTKKVISEDVLKQVLNLSASSNQP